MATADDIKVVRELLGPDAHASGWGDTRINNDLDAGLNANQIAAAWWDHRASSTANLVNVSESGSNRNLSAVHTQALALAKMYRDRVNAEDSGGEAGAPRSRLRSIPLRRV